MAKYDVVDEALIDADEKTVFNALLDEFLGNSSWWEPHLELRIRNNERVVTKGSIIDVTVNYPFGKMKFSERVVDIVENKLIKVEYFEGSILGTGEWMLEPLSGKTKIKYHWIGISERLLMTIISRFIKSKLSLYLTK